MMLHLGLYTQFINCKYLFDKILFLHWKQIVAIIKLSNYYYILAHNDYPRNSAKILIFVQENNYPNDWISQKSSCLLEKSYIKNYKFWGCSYNKTRRYGNYYKLAATFETLWKHFRHCRRQGSIMKILQYFVYLHSSEVRKARSQKSLSITWLALGQKSLSITMISAHLALITWLALAIIMVISAHLALITMVIMLRSKKNNRNNFYCLRPKHNHHGD